ncbi:MAG TPA: MFS transporter [Isosphaeraceae bacterium]
MSGWQDPSEAEPRRGTRVRYTVLTFTVALAAVTYLDRVCIAHAGVTASIKDELHLSDKQMSLVYSAFTLAYALFEMPTGAWGDRIGPRRVLTRIVLWWSSFTIATAMAFNYASLLLIRFLFGAGEAGAFPNVTKTFSRWFPTAERGTAQGIFFAGAHLGGGLTPILVTALLGYFHIPWRGLFVLFGSIGFVWALAWWRWFRDEPADHPAVDSWERKTIEAGRTPTSSHRLDFAIMRRILADRSLVALCLMYFTQAYGFYFNITWLPTYLARTRGLTTARLGLLASVLAGLPLILSSVADIIGGITTDAISRRHGLRVGRCGVGGASLTIAGCALIAGATVRDPIASALLIAVSGAAASFLLGSCWGVCQDIAGRHAGLVSGCMNTAGQIGAVISPIILPYFEDPAAPLCIAGALYLAGAACWLIVDPRRAIRVDPSVELDILLEDDIVS